MKAVTELSSCLSCNRTEWRQYACLFALLLTGVVEGAGASQTDQGLTELPLEQLMKESKLMDSSMGSASRFNRGSRQSLRGLPSSAGKTSSSTAWVTEEPINPRALDAIGQLTGPKDASLVKKVIGANLADTPPRVAQLRVAADVGYSEALRQAAHALKSSSANVGAEQLAALSKELEMLGRGGGGDGVRPLVARAEAEVARVIGALAAQLDGGM